MKQTRITLWLLLACCFASATTKPNTAGLPGAYQQTETYYSFGQNSKLVRHTEKVWIQPKGFVYECPKNRKAALKRGVARLVRTQGTPCILCNTAYNNVEIALVSITNDPTGQTQITYHALVHQKSGTIIDVTQNFDVDFKTRSRGPVAGSVPDQRDLH